jgi:hypothetical protein
VVRESGRWREKNEDMPNSVPKMSHVSHRSIMQNRRERGTRPSSTCACPEPREDLRTGLPAYRALQQVESALLASLSSLLAPEQQPPGLQWGLSRPPPASHHSQCSRAAMTTSCCSSVGADGVVGGRQGSGSCGGLRSSWRDSIRPLRHRCDSLLGRAIWRTWPSVARGDDGVQLAGRAV